MGIMEKLLGWAKNTPQTAPAPQEKFREAAGVTIDDDEDQWRRLSGDANRDLSPMTQRIASATLDLPEPFGPTTAVMP